jgi:arylsulfatase A-like enzyme
VGGFCFGPYDRWPTHSGFDKFYGFIGGETNQWAPAIYDGTIRVEPPHDPNYHFTVDMTNQAINWAQAQHSLTPDKPFFMYFATGALHAPHHAPKEYIHKYRANSMKAGINYVKKLLPNKNNLELFRLMHSLRQGLKKFLPGIHKRLNRKSWKKNKWKRLQVLLNILTMKWEII